MSFNIDPRALNNKQKIELLRFLSEKYKIVNNGKVSLVNTKWPLICDKGQVSLPLGVSETIKNLLPKFSIRSENYGIGLRKEQELFLDSVLVRDIDNIVPFSQAWDLRPGFGKTITCIAAIKFYNMETIVVVHRTALKNQWEAELAKYNVSNTKVMMISQLCRDCEMLVVDEAHACMTENGIKNISKIKPRVMIGLSGSFYRRDRFGPYLKWFFGPPIPLPVDAERILTDSITRVIDVDVIKTKFRPEVRRGVNGRLDWGAVIHSISFNDDRNNMIQGLVKEYNSKNILILVKLVDHGRKLAEIIGSTESVSTCFGSDVLDNDNISKRVLISTCQKIGTGVSINKLNCLILATDVVNYYIQYASRILREKGQDALIIDIVDDHKTLYKHLADRVDVYREIGANINYRHYH